MKTNTLTPDLIKFAYQRGAFPMGEPSGEIGWYEPYVRALFPIEGIHVSRSLSKTLRRNIFDLKFDTSFERVMRSCMRPQDNWINEELIEVYTQIFNEGWGHCSECWHEGELVGGVYGIAIGGCFCAESMFHRKTDASKVALKGLVDRCREIGFVMFDAQIPNPHLESLGSYGIPNREYLLRLRSAMKIQTIWS